KPIVQKELIYRVRNLLDRKHALMERVQHESSLDAAKEIQNTLISEEGNPIPPGISVFSYYKPAERIGGDWFSYFFDEKRNHLFAFIGDVTGHGLPSALFMCTVAGVIRGALGSLFKSEKNLSLAEILQEIASLANDTVYETGAKANKHLSMAFIGIDLSTSEAIFLNAGHPSPYIFGKDKLRPVLNYGSLLGFRKKCEFRLIPFRIEKGESIILYTDGLMENIGKSGRRSIPRELSALLKTNDLSKIRSYLEKVEKRQNIKDRNTSDDVAILILSRNNDVTPGNAHDVHSFPCRVSGAPPR
ncbi:MAG: serine/threonine-protein phosphatase, partial [Oligoflexales bacterium]|nr:serine/threonine-protein phosphatase [Oligoflexales bacterium]